MKIISGFLKGRNIEGYHLKGTRPTMDRVKESLFAMIQEKIENSVCLDLFSGSGNLGLEAISRGAKKVYFNDSNRKAVKLIEKNIYNFDISSYAVVLNRNYQKALKELKGKKFDLIFLDPPYETDYIEKSISLIEEYELLDSNGFIICESNDFNKIMYSEKFVDIKKRQYKDKWVVILKKI